MYKKLAGVGLSVLLISSIGYASPFGKQSVKIKSSVSESSLDTAEVEAREDEEGKKITVDPEAASYEGWVLGKTSTATATNTATATTTVTETDTATVTATSTEVTSSTETSTATTTETSTTQYTVVPGDCLSAIAGRLLGDMSRWPELVDLNKDKYPSLLSNPNLIYSGWILKIPGKEVASSPSNGTMVATSTSTNTNTSISTNTNTSVDTSNNSSQNTSSNTSTKTSTNTSTSTNANTSNNSGKAIITPDSRVLHIGDSHSCGVYGKTIDNLMRETGATVRTTAVAGSSPSWWMNGTTGKCGYYSKDENGKVTEPYWQTPMQTPLLQNLIDTYKPSVLVVSLGANMVGYSESSIRSQIDSICDKAKAAGCQIVWVGPPDSRSQDKNKTDKLYNILNSEVGKYNGVVVDSRQYTEYPSSGGDGLHYSGTEGTQKARAWAGSVMNVIQGK